MASLHSPPAIRAHRRATFSPGFCTEELGSESVSSSGNTSASEAKAAAAALLLPEYCGGGLYGSMQEGRGNDGGEGEGSTQMGNEEDGHMGCKASDNEWQYTKRGGVPTPARTFPPPITSLLRDRPLMRTCKLNGRFVLQRMATLCSSTFCAVRENGRLRLIPASSSPSDRELHSVEEEMRSPCIEMACAEMESSPTAQALMMSCYEEEGKAGLGSRSLCVPRSVKLDAGHDWATATHHHECLSTLRLLLLVAQTLSKTMASSSSSSAQALWTAKCQQQGKLHSEDFMELETPHIAASARGNTAIQREGPLEAYLKGKQGYAIISMHVGLIVLLLEIEGMVAVAKGIYMYKYAKANAQCGNLIEESIASFKEGPWFNPPSSGFSVLKPLDLTQEVLENSLYKSPTLPTLMTP